MNAMSLPEPPPPSVSIFSVKRTGRPRIVMGGPWTPLFSQMAEPPVPTERLISASCAKVSMFATQTPLPSEAGSIREYILTMFSQTMLSAACPVSFATETSAGEFITPSGWPTPEPPMKATSSNQEMAVGRMLSMKAANEMMESWSSSFGTSQRQASLAACRTTRPNFASASLSSAPSSAQLPTTPPKTLEAFDVLSMVGNGTREESIGMTRARARTMDDSSATRSSSDRSRSGTRKPPALGSRLEESLRIFRQRSCPAMLAYQIESRKSAESSNSLSSTAPIARLLYAVPLPGASLTFTVTSGRLIPFSSMNDSRPFWMPSSIICWMSGRALLTALTYFCRKSPRSSGLLNVSLARFSSARNSVSSSLVCGMASFVTGGGFAGGIATVPDWLASRRSRRRPFLLLKRLHACSTGFETAWNGCASCVSSTVINGFTPLPPSFAWRCGRLGEDLVLYLFHCVVEEPPPVDRLGLRLRLVVVVKIADAGVLRVRVEMRAGGRMRGIRHVGLRLAAQRIAQVRLVQRALRVVMGQLPQAAWRCPAFAVLLAAWQDDGEGRVGQTVDEGGRPFRVLRAARAAVAVLGETGG